MLKYKKMVMIESNGNGIKMMVSGITYTHSCTMDEFIYNTLHTGLFCGVHKSYIANIKKIDSWNDTTLELYMEEGINISFSVDGLATYRALLKPQKFRKLIH